MGSSGVVLVVATIVVTAAGASVAIPAAAVGGGPARSDAHSEPASLTRSLASPTNAAPRFRYRYVFASSGNVKLAAASGWNLLDVGSKWEADRLPAGTRGLMWVGDYDNEKCSFSVSDAALSQRVSGMAHDPKIAGYFYSDEPDPSACPNAPAEHRARSALIHRLSPGKLTVMVSEANSDQASLSQIPLWVGAADYVGFNPYVCLRGKPCDFNWIDSIIRAADKVGLPYWGAVQAFADSEWRWPTPAEERRMLSRWARSKAAGYMTFAWSWAGTSLSSRLDLLRVLRTFNGGSASDGASQAADRSTPTAGGSAQQVHFTFTGPRSVAFSWKGSAARISFGLTRRYSSTVTGRRAAPIPISSPGPFWEARLTGLKPSTRYHYSIGGGRDYTFTTAPRGPFRFDVEADIGASGDWEAVGATQRQIALDKPTFVLAVGDLTYGNDTSQASVDQHFNDVMAWSREAAYMPAWGNHEWDKSTDDLRNYKGRFVIPHGQASAGAPEPGCCGEDWGWFDAGGVRFISYPEPYDDSTWPDWKAKAMSVFAAAQASPAINFVVTFGHRPAYSTGYHEGDSTLAEILGSFGNRFSKYVLNFNGHSHNYERFRPIDRVTHITAAGGGSSLELPWSGKDGRTAYRAMHLEHVRAEVTPTTLRIQAICGPSASDELSSCRVGDVIDTVTIGRQT
jgi:hypothetical protein